MEPIQETAVCPRCSRDTQQIYQGISIGEVKTIDPKNDLPGVKIWVELKLLCNWCDELYHHRISVDSAIY